MLLYLSLFFFSVNFMLLGNYFLLIPFAYMLLKRKKIRVNTTVWILLAFSLIYIITEVLFSLPSETRLLFIVVAYLLGYNYDYDITEHDIRTVYFVVASGMGFHVLLNFFLAVVKLGGISFSATYVDFWSGTLSTTTGMMSNLVLFVPTFIFAIVHRGKSFLFIPFIIVGMIFGVMTGNRSTIIFFVVSTLAGGLIILFSGSWKKAVMVFAVIILVAAFLFLSYLFNWFGLREIYDNSYLSFRLNLNRSSGASLLETQRWDHKLKYISGMLDYPWGGGLLRQSVGAYAHDIWLDTWSSGGVFAFLTLSIYLITFGVRMVRFILVSEELSTKVLFFAYLVIIFLQFSVEPIIQGAPWLLISACLFDGIVSRYLVSRRRRLAMREAA